MPQALAKLAAATTPAAADDPADLSAVALLDAYAAKRLSPVETMRAVLDRVARREPELHALYALDAEGALADAAASARRWAKGEALPLDGVPVTIKENIATKGTPVPLGTAARTLEPAAEDAPPAARMREAGAIIFAKTTMPDYGMLSSGLSSFHALARNPWDLTKNPGGSSAGAGAAAAAGYGPLHIGTDIGGSIRLPAGWCGIFGLKPSLGRVPIDPPYWGRVAGPMTRTVADAALMMRELSQPDERDTMSLPPQDIAWLDLDMRKPAGAAHRPSCSTPASAWRSRPRSRRRSTGAAKRFEDRGARIVEPVAPFLTRAMLDGLDRFWRQRAWADIAALPPERQAKVLPYIRAWAEGGQPALGPQGLRRPEPDARDRDRGGRGLPTRFDLRALAGRAGPAFAAELASPLDDPARPFEHIAFTVPFNMSEQPAASVNAGYTAAGLPIGLQIVGRRFDDLGVLRMAHAFEAIRAPQRPWPLPKEE